MKYSQDPYFNSGNISYQYDNSNGISSELRVASLECRIETLEKMVKFYDDLINLKNEERKNEFNISFNETVGMFNSKIEQLEYKIEQMAQSNNVKIKEINDKIEHIYKVIEENKVTNDNENKSSNKEKEVKVNFNENNEILSNKISEIDAMINKNELMVENIVEEKLSAIRAENESKINEILTLIQDVNKFTEDHEFAITELRETVRGIQNENVDVIKVVSVQTEKIKQVDFVIDQITELKEKMSKLVTIFGDNQKEEEEFRATKQKEKEEIQKKKETKTYNYNNNSNYNKDRTPKVVTRYHNSFNEHFRKYSEDELEAKLLKVQNSKKAK